MSSRELPMVGDGTLLPHVTRPVLLAVHGEPAIACALERPLRREFASRGYEAMCVDTASSAIDLLRILKERGEDVAILVTDQRLSGTTGLDLIGEARKLHPTVRTVLLVDASDMQAAVEATGGGSLDYFLVRPLTTPEEQLLPVAADLLDDWERWVDAGAQAVRVVGRRTVEARAVLRFLDGNDVHRQFLDLDSDARARLLLDGRPEDSLRLPLVVLGD